MNKPNQFVTVPNEVVDCEEISPKSLVVYCAIKRHINKETLTCYPEIKTIAEEAGCGKDVVLNAIKELESNGFITVIKRNGKSNLYKFSKHKSFEPFSYDFLNDTNIKIREKAYLIAQQKNMFIKDTGYGISSMSTDEIAKKVKMSKPTLLSCENTLIKAGYLAKANSKYIEPDTNLHEKLRLYFLQLYNAVAITYKQTQENAEDIKELKEENKELRKQIEILQRAIFKKEEVPEITI